jgi:prophage DNA circulation protein
MPIAAISDIHNPWRDALQPAAYRGAMFHVEAGTKEDGRRIVVHEFPKKDVPFSEDMGRRAIAFTVRAYCIQYPRDTSVELYQRDYRVPRDHLIRELEQEGSGTLQLPTLQPLTVVCQGYRLTEEERLGGYCVFDIQFVEAGSDPFQPSAAVSGASLNSAATAMNNQVLNNMTAPAVKPTAPGSPGTATGL